VQWQRLPAAAADADDDDDETLLMTAAAECKRYYARHQRDNLKAALVGSGKLTRQRNAASLESATYVVSGKFYQLPSARRRLAYRSAY